MFTNSSDLSVVTITDQAVFNSWLSRLEASPLFAFDTETTSLNYMQAEIVGLSFAIEPGEAAYVPLAHLNPGLEGQLDRDRILDQMKPLLESDAVKKVGQHQDRAEIESIYPRKKKIAVARTSVRRGVAGRGAGRS